MASEKVFECRKCGQCCEGRGGIVLSGKDLTRLADFLGLSSARTLAEYGETANGKMRLRTGPDGYCVFFRQDTGCSVHEGKPDICRAWPYFRGNLEDEASFQMAREYCPGIYRGIGHAEFVEEGRRYLSEYRLTVESGENAANSLVQADKERG